MAAKHGARKAGAKKRPGKTIPVSLGAFRALRHRLGLLEGAVEMLRERIEHLPSAERYQRDGTRIGEVYEMYRALENGVLMNRRNRGND